jgi:hypothetical protein
MFVGLGVVLKGNMEGAGYALKDLRSDRETLPHVHTSQKEPHMSCLFFVLKTFKETGSP